MIQVALQAIHFSAAGEITGATNFPATPILGDPVPEGPILFLHLNEINKYILGTKR